MTRIFGQYFSLRRMVFILGEGVLIFLGVALASYVLIGRGIGMVELIQFDWPQILLITAVTQLSLYFNDLYEANEGATTVELGLLLVQSVGITSIFLAVIYMLWPAMMIGRWAFFASVLVIILFLVSWRLLYSVAVAKKLFCETAVLIGAGDLASNLLTEFRNRKDIGYDIRCIFTQGKEEAPAVQEKGIELKRGFESLCKFTEAENIKNIIVALDEKRGVMPYSQLLECKMKGLSIIDGESFYERMTGKLLVEKINPSWLIFSDGFIKSPFTRFSKRVVGLGLSLFMVVMLSPLLILTALAIKLDSRGPVIFSQDRVGENERIYKVYKFRSMKADAEAHTGPVWAEEDDPRITRVGRIIRKLRIDELPQLWNVLKGDMSFVGPRPERPYFVEKLKKTVPYYKERFAVKPGITGWAQVKYPYGASEEDALQKLKYDLYYVKNMSIIMDLMVIFYTVKIVLLGRGSR